MIKEANTPVRIFVQENDKSMKYGVDQDHSIQGMVAYIREDFVPDDSEMLEFAKAMTRRMDDGSMKKDDLMAKCFLEGYRFAKKNRKQQC